MLPVLDPNRNNIRPARVEYGHVMAALLWAQMLMPRRDFDRLMAGIQASAAATGGYITYKVINGISVYVPQILEYIQLSQEGKLTKKSPDSQEEADLIVKSIKDTANEGSKRPRDTTDSTPVSKKQRSDHITPDAKQPTEVGISPQGNLIAPPGSTYRRSGNLRGTQLTMADVEMGSSSTTENKQNEVTPVSKFDYAFEGIPRQYTTILPYEVHGLQTSLNITQGSLNYMLFIRMNSIYDILKNPTTWVSNPNPTASTTDGIINKPYWREHWMQYYEYWTVLECRYKIKVWNTTKVGDRPMGCFWGYTGIQQPPLTISGGSAVSDVDLTYENFRRWKGFKNSLIHAAPSEPGAQTIPLNADTYCHTIKGVYHPGDGSHEVVEDELAQTWIRGDNVPKEENNLCIILTRGPGIIGTTAMSFRVRIELEYVVQFKDQKEIWQFPRPTATSNFDKAY